MTRVLTIANGGQGRAYDLTNSIEGLSFSNVDPGGDELASFTYKRPWAGSALPEVAKGNILIIEEGLDVLWQGRIGEPSRGGSETEELSVTGYGLGSRLKDNQHDQIYVDQDLGSWQTMSRARRIALLGMGYDKISDFSVDVDTTTGSPALIVDASGAWSSLQAGEAYYDAGALALVGLLTADWSTYNIPGAYLGVAAAGSDDQLASGYVSSGDQISGSEPRSGSISFSPGGRRWLALGLAYAGSAPDQERRWILTNVRVYGTHGITPRAGGGLYASDVIPVALAGVAGIKVRQVDATTLEIGQLVSHDTYEALIESLHAFHKYERSWGTWGASDVFAPPGTGYFDWTTKPTAAQWIAPRENLESLDLNSEIDGLFDTVILSYTDAAGASQQTTRTLASPDLDAAGLTGKTARVSAGTLAPAAANALGDAILAFNGGYAPARGSVSIARPIRHSSRGQLPPQYLRADGSMIRIPDILPSSTLFTLDGTPDRRTTFPIKRVRVDMSGSYPKATVEVDQTNDLISTLEARLAAAADALG